MAKAGGARGGGAGSRWRTRGRDGRWSGSEDIRLDSGVAGSPVKAGAEDSLVWFTPRTDRRRQDDLRAGCAFSGTQRLARTRPGCVWGGAGGSSTVWRQRRLDLFMESGSGVRMKRAKDSSPFGPDPLEE